ncbi:MAG: DMT family transporter [Christensenellales bacterium]|jgi:drug/metabolite transporter (DMT)-like permease
MKNSKTESRTFLVGALCAIGCEILYGLSFLFTKRVTESVRVFPLLGWRFFIAFFALHLCVALRIVRIDLKGKSLKPLFLVALFCPCLYFIGETMGISLTTASESGVFLASIPIASLTASAWFLGKKPTIRQVVGICVTLAGVLATVFATSASASLSGAGYAFLTAAVITYALYSVFVEKAAGFSSAEITYIMLLAGAVFFGAAAVLEGLARGDLADTALLPFRDGGFLAAVLYHGIGCSVLAFFLSNESISRIGVNGTAAFIGVSTVVSILSGVVFLRESFTAKQWAATAVILAGVYIASSKQA